MLNSRKELMARTRELYINLMQRVADRYTSRHKYTIIDGVGFNVTLAEELLRPLWGIAPIINECEFDITVEGKKIPVSEFITRVMIECTDPESDRRFDKDISDYSKYFFANQCTTEIAGYLVAVCYAKEKLWDSIPEKNREAIAAWIKKWSFEAIRKSWANNHYWYPIFCIEILKKLGYDCSEVDAEMKAGYDFLETLYYGEGWYSDGELGKFDYYEAWAHHAYTLLWILIADKNSDGYEEKANTYRRRSEKFLEYFAHYFDSDGGLAIYGRSNSYRFAACCPFGLAALAGCNIDLGKTKNLILKNISYFFDNCTMVDGCLPCGYLYQSTGFTESYTCDGSITCYTEGLMCLLASEEHPLWQSEVKPLEIEDGNYSVKSKLDGLEIILHGEDSKNGVTLFNNSLHYYQSLAYTFNDMAGLYSKFAYNSRSGFTLSTRDIVAIDNMISLATKNMEMVSHRQAINDIGYEDGIMFSTHTPFANDPATTIKTWLIPLWSGFHVRVHKVKLNSPYIIREGSFSVGIDSDAFNTDVLAHTATFGKHVSYIDTVSDVPVKYIIMRAHPGMNSHKPHCLIPIYSTELLEPGEYVFATTLCFTTDGVIENNPVVSVKDGVVTVEQGDIKKVIKV